MSLNPEDVIIGIIGFCTTWFVWTIVSPIMNTLIATGVAMMLPDIANQKFGFIQMLFDNAMLINAGIWILYILLSSVRTDIEERQFIG